MRVTLDSEQLIWACRGLRMNDTSKGIAHDYFCEGIRKIDLARKYDVTTPYISKLIRRVEKNLLTRLEKYDMEIKCVISRK